MRLLLRVVALALTIVPTPTRGQDRAVVVTQLSDRLYLFTATDGFAVNLVASSGEDGLLLVDTGHQSTGQELASLLGDLGLPSPSLIINTHAHTDHTGGNAVFGAAPIIIGHWLLRHRLQSGRYVMEEVPDNALPDIAISHPTTIFFNGEEIQITPVPGGHSDNDLVVFFTQSRVAVFGDVAYGMHFPSWDPLTGNVLGYADAVAAAIRNLPDDVRVISGHGRICSLDDMKQFHRMLADTRDVVRDGLAQGKTVTELKSEDVLGRWRREGYGEGYVSADRWIGALAAELEPSGPRPTKSIMEPMYYALADADAQVAVDTYYRLKADHPDEYLFTEDRLLLIGMWLLEKERPVHAARLFEVNLVEYPAGEYEWYVLEQLARAQEMRGQTQAAIESLEKSLTLNARNERAKSRLEALRH